MGIRSLYVGDEALKEARSIQQEASSPQFSRTPADLGDFVPSDWNDFDSVYLWLLRLAVADHSSQVCQANRMFEQLEDSFKRSVCWTEDQAITIDFLLDIDVSPQPESGLISEHAVLSLVNFFTVFKKRMPFEATITQIDLGCVFARFAVRIPNYRVVALDYDIKAENAGIEVVTSHINTPAWKQMFKRFRVLQHELKLLTP